MNRLFGFVALLVSVGLIRADWPVFRGDPAMTGIGDAKLPDQLAIKWKFKTNNAIEGAPAIVAGVVYVASADKHLYAVDVATGDQKWKQKLGAPIKASPAVKDGRVYVGDVDGKLFCRDAATGKEVWTYECPGEINSGCNFFKDTILVGSYDGTLTAVSLDGKKVWEFKLDQPINGSPAVAEDRTFVAGCDNVLHVIDATTGKELAAVDIEGQSGATAAVAGDFVVAGTMSNQVVAVNWKAAKKAWAFEAPRRQQPFFASAALAGDRAVVGSRDKKVYAVELKTGNEAWNFTTDGMVDGSAVVVKDRVYVGCLSNDGNFYALDLKTGKKLQELNLDSPVTGSPAVGPDCILIGTEKGTLYCLGAK
jgi:outer membrane protein assembly factor BamB